MHKSHRFDIKKSKNFLGRGQSPLPRPHSQWGGGYTPSAHPTSLGAFGASILAPSAPLSTPSPLKISGYATARIRLLAVWF